jgi:hypothetical protein
MEAYKQAARQTHPNRPPAYAAGFLFMTIETEQRSKKRVGFRILRRLLKSVVLLAVGLLLLAFAGVAVVWGHYWDFRVGDPTSESCASCHILDTYVNSLSDDTLLVQRHVQAGYGCVDCHERTLQDQIHETITYLQQDYQVPFMRAQYSMDTCFSCHEHTSYEQLAWRTMDLGVTDAQARGHAANPHQSPHYSDLECHSCHRMHRPSVLLCSECHAYQFRIPVISPQ